MKNNNQELIRNYALTRARMHQKELSKTILSKEDERAALIASLESKANEAKEKINALLRENGLSECEFEVFIDKKKKTPGPKKGVVKKLLLKDPDTGELIEILEPKTEDNDVHPRMRELIEKIGLFKALSLIVDE